VATVIHAVRSASVSGKATQFRQSGCGLEFNLPAQTPLTDRRYDGKSFVPFRLKKLRESASADAGLLASAGGGLQPGGAPRPNRRTHASATVDLN